MSRQRMKVVFSGFLAGGFFMLVYLSGAFLKVEESVIQKLRLSPKHPEPVGLGLVLIEDVETQGWPLSRLDGSLILRALRPFMPAVVGMDLPLSEPGEIFPEHDKRLFREAGRLSRSVVFSSTARLSGLRRTPPVEVRTIPYRGNIDLLADYSDASWPMLELLQSCSTGPCNIAFEADGKVRRVPLVFRFGRQLIPSWILRIFGELKGVHWPSSHAELGNVIELRSEQGLLLARFPIDERGAIALDFSASENPPLRISFGDVFVAKQQYLNGEKLIADMNTLRGGVVLIAPASEKVTNMLSTEKGKRFPVELQLVALQNLLSYPIIRRVPPIMLGGWVFAAALVGTLSTLFAMPWRLLLLIAAGFVFSILPWAFSVMGTLAAPVAISSLIAFVSGAVIGVWLQHESGH